MTGPLLEVEGLRVGFRTRHGAVDALRGVSLSLRAGGTLGIVGESGSGKSVTSLAVMRLLDRAGRITGGRIRFMGQDITRAGRGELRRLRGAAMSMVFQNPRAALNPIRTVGRQIADVLHAHGNPSRAEARAQALDLLRAVRIRDPERRLHAYPGELSGGMCQRVGIALAIACEPSLLIADEPTTGLDVTTQAQVMDLLAGITAARGMAMVLITHDLGLAARYCGAIAVMEAGLVVEQGPAAALFGAPRHPYTRRLIAASPTRHSSLADLVPEGTACMVPGGAPSPAPRTPEAGAALPASGVGAPMVTAWDKTIQGVAIPAGGAGAPGYGAAGQPADSAQAPGSVSGVPASHAPAGVAAALRGQGSGGPVQAAPLLEVAGVCKTFPGPVRAVDGVSFGIPAGGSLGLVGESGSGKTTVSRLVCRLLDPDAGAIRFRGQDLAAIPAGAFHLSPLRRAVQIVFQDPHDSLNPRFTAADAIAHPLRRLDGMRDGAALDARVREAAARAGLPGDLLDRYPHQLSGGQKARVGIARAIAPRPALLILDEPTAALDVSVQAGVLQLLDRLRREDGLALLFVSHDLNVVRMMCDSLVVMQHGRVVEAGPAQAVFDAPAAEYTRTLLDAVPHFDPHGGSHGAANPAVLERAGGA